jgi:hypothetical protein
MTHQNKNSKEITGEIIYNRTDLQLEFQEAVDKGSLDKTEKILKEHPEFVRMKPISGVKGS